MRHIDSHYSRLLSIAASRHATRLSRRARDAAVLQRYLLPLPPSPADAQRERREFTFVMAQRVRACESPEAQRRAGERVRVDYAISSFQAPFFLPFFFFFFSFFLSSLHVDMLSISCLLFFFSCFILLSFLLSFFFLVPPLSFRRCWRRLRSSHHSSSSAISRHCPLILAMSHAITS